MVTFAQSLILIVSVLGIFFIFFILTDKDYIKSKGYEKDKKVDIYTYNLDEKTIDEIVKIFEKSKRLEGMVDIVNIYERFDKK